MYTVSAGKIIQIAAVLAGILVIFTQSFHVPPGMDWLFTAISILQAIAGIKAFAKNPDGTPAETAYVAPPTERTQ